MRHEDDIFNVTAWLSMKDPGQFCTKYLVMRSDENLKIDPFREAKTSEIIISS